MEMCLFLAVFGLVAIALSLVKRNVSMGTSDLKIEATDSTGRREICDGGE
ncbi:MAG TPA: hypothetical protein VGM05_05595 [Planctomycetaceae bacterium]|jgi:hypothetical protein